MKVELVIELKIAEIFSSPLFHGCFIDCFVVFFSHPQIIVFTLSIGMEYLKFINVFVYVIHHIGYLFRGFF